MTAITVSPIIITDCTLKLGTDNYEAHVAKATLTPSVTVVTRKGLTPTAVFQAAGAAVWTLDLDITQDYETVDSLSNFLFDSAGTVVTAQLAPLAGGTAWDFSVLCVPQTIGGEVDAIATSDASLPVVGQPTRAA